MHSRISNDGPDGYEFTKNRFAQGQHVVFMEEVGPYFPGTKAEIVAVPLMSVEDSYIVSVNGKQDHSRLLALPVSALAKRGA